ncbi:hypothetical protein [Cyanobium sp. Morenito 9A2]|uniref:hypothetical protein n=1 Tax=Cyanobium sp. Morenito 9A2 TaxID=2823718 RepID=UPI0020CCD573|nr:hypothetical protein [Cyanobium sp. Morenito 9A2]MCP9850416.1 hypothetical protein [Cyanobium sp. Morenito 9A2]
MAPAQAVTPPAVFRWIKTDCGRAQYSELATRPGPLARLRLVWFVVVAALRDWPLAEPADPLNPANEDQGNS